MEIRKEVMKQALVCRVRSYQFLPTQPFVVSQSTNTPHGGNSTPVSSHFMFKYILHRATMLERSRRMISFPVWKFCLNFVVIEIPGPCTCYQGSTPMLHPQFLAFWDRVSLRSSGWPWAHHVTHTVSGSEVRGLQVGTTHLAFRTLFEAGVDRFGWSFSVSSLLTSGVPLFFVVWVVLCTGVLLPFIH